MAFDEAKHPRVPKGEPGGGRFVAKEFSDDKQVIDDIVKLIEADDDYNEFGVRVEDVDRPLAAGSDLPPSRVWDDGVATDEVLDGTSVIGINRNKDLAEEVGRALRLLGATSDTSASGYGGKVIYLVRGSGGAAGTDRGEIVMRASKVHAVYTRDDDFFAPIKRRLAA